MEYWIGPVCQHFIPPSIQPVFIMKFIADSMLGRLARWLRLLGHDTLYFPSIEDSLLLRIAREEKRTLLTRDTRLVKVRGLKDYLLLRENDPFRQLKLVITSFSLIPSNKPLETVLSPQISRCSLCNAVLEHISKEEAGTGIPEYVRMTVDSIRKCPRCDKYYWEGTHQDRMKKKLMDVLRPHL